MTDHLTLELFGSRVAENNIVRAPVSRLVLDVERFEDDALEPMSARGMGAIYTKTSTGTPLRRRIEPEERAELLVRWYRPHHRHLESVVAGRLDRFDRTLIVDAPSFPSVPLPYEPVQDRDRPEICIGTDAFHTPPALATRLIRSFENEGFTVALNTPFAGALVPLAFHRKERRVSSIMIEIRRDLYIDETSGLRNDRFASVAERIGHCLDDALETNGSGS